MKFTTKESKMLALAVVTVVTSFFAPEDCLGQSYFKILNANSGKALSVAKGSKQNEAPLVQREYRGLESQMWQIQKKNGGFCFINRFSKKAIDVPRGSKDLGTRIIQYSFSGSHNQKWGIRDAPSGRHQVISAASTGLVLEVNDGSTAENAPVNQWKYQNQLSQQWSIVPVNKGRKQEANNNSKVKWPIVAKSKTSELGNHRRVRVGVELYANGKMIVKTKTWTDHKYEGFSGSPVVGLLNGQGELIYVWKNPPRYGVNGRWAPGAPSSRTDSKVVNIPAHIAKQTRAIKRFGVTNPAGTVKKLEEFLNSADSAISVLGSSNVVKAVLLAQ